MLHDLRQWFDSLDPQEECSLFESGVILAGCLFGMAIMVLLAWIF